ncbi:hypothetical protein CLV63_12968 [Murinocardiopsis flavida]|uniref:Uncharacterized protein n=1 Tax=Murinocardiopsis flavida TaxID=645275 RepID=A0A2P8CV12_9ACTN|nr:hypothetical protein [Murinocardiopsis flavida]PSK88779.1 hypothetical protein CLV63_12968 [Murinocardiopsis flavida]
MSAMHVNGTSGTQAAAQTGVICVTTPTAWPVHRPPGHRPPLPSPGRLDTEVPEWPAPWLGKPMAQMTRDELAQALSIITRFFPDDEALGLALGRELADGAPESPRPPG